MGTLDAISAPPNRLFGLPASMKQPPQFNGTTVRHHK